VKRNSALRCLAALSRLAVGSVVFVARNAAADVTLWSAENTSGGWEIFTNGRVGIFASWARGDGSPAGNTYADPVLDPMTMQYTSTLLHQVKNDTGGIHFRDEQIYNAPNPDGTPSPRQVSSVNHLRVRSGFTGNAFGFGLRRNLDETTKVTAYFSLATIVDSTGQSQIGLAQPTAIPDVREAYIKFEGNWGSVLAGRSGTLFNRGAVVTDFLYLHGYGLGFPGDLSTSGGFPTAGQIGFGVLANGFAAGFVYSTPVVAGLQLNVGLYDPASMTGSAVERTKEPRAEFEATANEPLGSIGKVHVYVNGGYQNHYAQGATDDRVEKAVGVGFGTRVEVGPVHIGAGGHRGTGISLTYMGIPGGGSYDDTTQFLKTDGYFVIGQVALGKFDVSGAYGISRIALPEGDLVSYPGNAVNPANGFPDPQFSWIKSQAGISVALVYHANEWLHFGADAMFTTSKWNLGEQQKINFYNAGTTLTW
jgi:hypothetical protein